MGPATAEIPEEPAPLSEFVVSICLSPQNCATKFTDVPSAHTPERPVGDPAWVSEVPDSLPLSPLSGQTGLWYRVWDDCGI